MSAPVSDKRPIAAQPITPRSWWTRTRVTIISALALGAAWSAGAFGFVWQWEDTLAANELAAISRNHVVAVQDGLDGYLGKLWAVRALMETHNNLSRSEFSQFTRRLLAREAGVQNFSWVPHVSRATRQAFEAAARLDGIPDYTIRQVMPEDTLIPSPDRDEYLPIYYSSVADKASRVYGIDLHSQEVFHDRLDRARDGIPCRWFPTSSCTASPATCTGSCSRCRSTARIFRTTRWSSDGRVFSASCTAHSSPSMRSTTSSRPRPRRAASTSICSRPIRPPMRGRCMPRCRGCARTGRRCARR